MTDEGAYDRARLCGLLSIACPDLFGGLLIKAGQGPLLRVLIEEFESFVPDDGSGLILPSTVSFDRLHRSLSVARSLAEGAPIYQSGLLEDARGRLLIVNGVDRLQPGVASSIAAEIDGSHHHDDAPFAFVGIDESYEEGGLAPAALSERLAFRADLSGVRLHDYVGSELTSKDVLRVREDIHGVQISDDDLSSIAIACVSLGITSMRVPVYCMHAARALAALDRREDVTREDITLACQLVLPGRGRVIPQTEERSTPDQGPPDSGPQEEGRDRGESADGDAASSMEAQIIEAVASAPVHLSSVQNRRHARSRSGISGRSGEHVLALDRGRPDRPVQGQFGRGRVDVLASLRTAAPMQKVRQTDQDTNRLSLRKSDLRIKRFKRRKQSSVIFVVDASGSAAMHRMAEAKGAVERLLSQCYSRRDLVSLISFSGDHATLVLSPSRSLVRARRQITDLAGGGATPLAHALVETFKLARSEQDRGRSPFLVFLTDGRGNMTLDGQADRQASSEESSRLARSLIKDRFPVVFFDTSRRPDPRTRRLSDDLGAQYQFLPSADGETVSRVVRQNIGSR